MTARRILAIAGPTASGKTALALELAQRTQAIILSADSRMVYQGLDIGTSKPTWEYRERIASPWQPIFSKEEWGPVYKIHDIEHHLLDIREPGEDFSLAAWLRHVDHIFSDERYVDRPVIIVGGTHLYLKALREGYILPPTNFTLRRELEELSNEEIVHQLKKYDPQTLLRESGNRRRLIRALEVYQLTGRKLADQPRRTKQDFPIFSYRWSRPELYQRINERVRERYFAGLQKEIDQLIASGISEQWLRTIGLEYRIMLDNKGVSDEQLIAHLQAANRAYARRQITFMRTQLHVQEVDLHDSIGKLADLLHS